MKQFLKLLLLLTIFATPLLTSCEGDIGEGDLGTIIRTKTPVISSEGDDSDDISVNTNITLSSSEDDAKIYYTLDGSNPEIGEGTTEEYTAPFTIGSSGKCTVKAVAKLDYKKVSYPMARMFTVSGNISAAPVITPASGDISVDDKVMMSSAVSGAKIYYTIDGTDPVIGNSNTLEYSFGFSLQQGTYVVKAIAKEADKGQSNVVRRDYKVVSQDKVIAPIISASHSEPYTTSTIFSISCATAGASIEYKIGSGSYQTYAGGFNLSEGTYTIRARASKSGMIDSDESVKTVVIPEKDKVSTPVISASHSAPYNSNTVFSITCSTSSASILYKLDNGNYSTYSTGIQNLSEGTHTIYAKAISTGMIDSDETSMTVTIQSAGKVEAPVISANHDAPHNTDTTFSISSATSGASIEYKIDGGSYQTYSSAISLSEGTHTIKAMATKGGMEDSDEVSSTFEILPQGLGLRLYFKSSSSNPTIWLWEKNGTSISEEMGFSWDTQPAMTAAAYDQWYYFDIPDSFAPFTKEINFKVNKGNEEYSLDPTAGKFWYDGSTWHAECPDGNQAPRIDVNPAGGFFQDTKNVYVTFPMGEPTLKEYRMNSGSWQTLPPGDMVRIGDGMNDGDKVTLEFRATNENGTTIVGPYEYEKGQQVMVDDIDNLRIFQVMVCSFIDGDPNVGYTWQWNEGFRANGDIQGVINSIDYIKSLGMNAIWLTPIFHTYGGKDARQAHNGYFTNDYFNIDPNFGTNDKFRELVTKAHAAGLYIFLDGVLGHNAGGCETGVRDIAASPLSNKRPNMQNPVNYQDGGDSLQFYKDVVYYWIRNYKVDGYRFDQSYQLGPGNDGHQGQGGNNFYWDDIREEIERACNENKAEGDQWGTLGYTVGEDWEGEGGIATNTYGKNIAEGLHSAFDFPTRYKVIQSFAREEGGREETGNRASNLNSGYGTHSAYPDWAHPTMFIGNHDVGRFGALVRGSNSHNNNYYERHKAIFSFMAAYTGPICTYYGEEWGDDRGGIPGDMHVARTDGKTSGFNSEQEDLRNYVTSVMNMRSQHPALWNGSRTNLKASGDQYVDLKVDGSDKMVYVQNTGTSSQTISFSVSGSSRLVNALNSSETVNGGGNYSVTVGPLESKFFVVE